MDREIERLWERAEQQLRLGHTDGAIEGLRQLLSLDPDLGRAHALLGICLLTKRRLEAAHHEIGLALTLDPEDALTRYAAAEVLMAQRRFREAEGHVQALLAIDATVPAYHRTQARLYDLTERQDARLAALDKALEMDPEDPETLSDLAECWLERNDLERAEALSDEALRLAPESPDAHTAKGRLCLRRDRVEEAREHALQALRADPGDLGALQLIAAVKARKSPLLGLWWRYNSWMTTLGATRSILVLLGAFLVYRILTIATQDAGQSGLALCVQIAWLGIVAYTFVGPGLFRRALNKEIAEVSLKRDF